MPVVFDQSYSNPFNSGTIEGGATIAAPGVWLTNTDSGRIYGGVIFTVGGSTLDNRLGGWIGNSSNVIAGPLVTGSDGADTVVNGGIIAGAIALGAGDDLFLSRSRSSGQVDLGSGDDTYRVEGPDSIFIDADGSAGIDRLVFAGSSGQYWASVVKGFEELVFEDGGSFYGFSGFQSIIVQPFSTQRPYVQLVNSANPGADVALNGSWLMLIDSSVGGIIGNGASNAVDMVGNAMVSNGMWLGAGDDTLTLRSVDNGPSPTLTSVADGGSGIDTLLLQWTRGGDRSFDLSAATGFERLNINVGYTVNELSTTRVSNAVGLRDIDVGKDVTLVLSNSILPDARASSQGGGGIVIETGVTIDRYGFAEYGPWDFRLDIAQGDPTNSVKITNSGTIENDIRFYTGDDLYDGRNGAVGGTVYGNAGNDRLLGGSGAERFVGGYGADTLQGGGGADILTGGAGRDLFLDTAAGHDGDVITDFSRGDRLVFSDASLDSFAYSFNGNIFTYGGGSLTLEGLQGASLAITRAAEGGVQVAFSSPPVVVSGGAAVSLTLEAESLSAPKAAATLADDTCGGLAASTAIAHDPVQGSAAESFWPFAAAIAGDVFAVA